MAASPRADPLRKVGQHLADLCRSSRTASDHSQPDRGPADLLKTRAKLNEGFRMIRFFGDHARPDGWLLVEFKCDLISER